MPRFEVGILGVRKDPSKQVLFNFGVRQGEEWPSEDSGDSDYNPGNQEAAQSEDSDPESQPRNSKAKKVLPKSKKKNLSIAASESDSEEDSETNVPSTSRKTTNQKLLKNKQKRPTLDSESEEDSDTYIPSTSKKTIEKNKGKPKRTKTTSKTKGNEKSKPAKRKREPSSTNTSQVARKKFKRQSEDLSSGDDFWGNRLPEELLLKIFEFVVGKDGALPFLCRAARVCRLWYDVSCDPMLWTNVDLSYGWVKAKDATLQWLCSNRFSQLQHLNISSWKALTNAGIEVIADHCPVLESINLSGCTKLTPGSIAVKTLADRCPNLASLDLSSTSTDTVSGSSLKYLASTCGPRLKHLTIARNILKAFNLAFNAIMENCPNLIHLDISNVNFSSDFFSLNIEKFQASCPKLQVLQLTNSKFRGTYASQRVCEESPGFPELEQLSLAISTKGLNVGIGIDDDFLHRILKSSLGLRLLDLRGCTHITNAGLVALPVTDLEHLYISQSAVAKYEGIEDIMQKWQHSLVEVDLSWNMYPENSLDDAMRNLAADPAKSQLRILNLSGTNVTGDRVRSLLEGCPLLHTLNLGSCRGLPRGMKSLYTGDKLKILRKDIKKMDFEDA